VRTVCQWIALLSVGTLTALTSPAFTAQGEACPTSALPSGEEAVEVVATARMKQVHTSQLFVIEHSRARGRATDDAAPVASSEIPEGAGERMNRAFEVQRSQERTPDSDHPTLVTLRPAMLAHNIQELAGQNVKILNARVVGVFEPHAFLIESATRYDETLEWRDRILVLIDGGKLRVPDDAIVASTVNVLGVARTLIGVQVSAEVPWPAKLNRDLIQRLEVRAAVLATSVRTAEGTELTDRRRPTDAEPKR